ncbi:MAG: HEAT repeat domain-containing protein [Planctomycetales bacterium]|nr:HEAT repeat domain-containing protein [Planctomycetales bacterium]
MSYARTAGLSFLAAAALASPARAQSADEKVLRDSERRVVAAASEWRTAQGLPALVYCETVGIVLREHIERLARLGWRGGPFPREAGRATDRARRLHRIQGPIGEIYDNFTVVNVDQFDPNAVVQDLSKIEAIKSLARAELRLAGCGVAVGDPGRWLIVLALAEGDPTPFEKAAEAVRVQAEKARSPDKAARHAAVQALGGLRSLEAHPALREAAASEDPETRFLAMQGLGALRSRAAVPDLVAALRDADGTVRTAAAGALIALTARSDLGSDPVKWASWWDAVRDTLASPGEEGPAAATAAPAEPATPAAAPPLPEVLDMWKKACELNDTVRRVMALELLRAHNEPKAHQVFLACLSDRDPMIRISALRGLAWQRVKPAVNAIMNVAKAAEKQAQQETERRVAQIAFLALAQIGDLRALPLFLESAWESRDKEVLTTKLFAIRYLRDARSVDHLLSLVTKAKRWEVEAYAWVIQTSLESLTGENFGKDLEGWRGWWKRSRDRFQPQPLEKDYRVEFLFDDLGGDKERDKKDRRGKKE